jgi:AraC family transcriptional regulator
MNYKIVDKPPFKVVGKGIRASTKDCQKKLPQFWWECYQNGFSATLEKMADPDGVTGEAKLGICMESELASNEFCYFIGVEHTRGTVPEGMIEKEIPAATWAVFESIGPMPSPLNLFIIHILS